MKIAIIGAGAIGSLVAGYLKVKDFDVSLVGHPGSVKAIKERGLKISGVRGDFNVAIDISERLDFVPDLAVLAVKTQDLDRALEENLKYLAGSIVVTAQNGIRCDDIAAKYFPRENIVSSIVMFGATSLLSGEILHNFDGNWIFGSGSGKNEDKVSQVSGIFGGIFPVTKTENIKGMKCLKIFVNANNCIPAIIGLSMQEAFSDTDTSRVSIEIWKEGLRVMRAAGIELVSLPDFPLERLNKLTAMPTQQAAGIFSGIMLNLSKEPLYGSILQSIKRGKASEIDYINGEFVRLAQENNIAAPLNQKLVDMVHQVEKTGNFFSRQDLLSAVKGLYDSTCEAG